MIKIARYITAAVLAACLLCMTAISALAYTEGCFRYEVTDGVITITEYFGREENVTVPSMIAGTPVSIIGENVFPDGCGVKQVNLPDTIMQVQDNSFGASVNVVYATIPEQTTTAAPVPVEPIVTEPSVSENTGAAPVMPYTSAADIVTTRTDDGAVYIVEETAEDNTEELAEDIGEGGMEEDEDVIIDITPADTSVPDYIVIAPGTGTVSEASTTKPLDDIGAVSTSANENGEAAAVTDDNGEAVATSAGEDKPTTAEDGAIAEAGDNAPATENSPEASAEKPQNNSTLLYVIIYAAAAIAVAAVVIIVLIKRKKK